VNHLVIVAALLVACTPKTADAEPAEPTVTEPVAVAELTAREHQMFALGQQLSRAALGNGRTHAIRAFRRANAVIAEMLLVQLDPLPAITGNPARDHAAALAYLMVAQGQALTYKISALLGERSAAAFQLGLVLGLVRFNPRDSDDVVASKEPR
jgi:hypothetical protein